MSKKIRKITADDVLAAAEKYKGSRRKNPLLGTDDDEGRCLYTDRKNPNRHCLGGQILVDLDIPLPDEFVGIAAASYPAHIRFEYTALNLLMHLQDFADGGYDGEPRRTWGKAITLAVGYVPGTTP